MRESRRIQDRISDYPKVETRFSRGSKSFHLCTGGGNEVESSAASRRCDSARESAIMPPLERERFLRLGVQRWETFLKLGVHSRSVPGARGEGKEGIPTRTEGFRSFSHSGCPSHSLCPLTFAVRGAVSIDGISGPRPEKIRRDFSSDSSLPPAFSTILNPPQSS